MKAFSIVGFLIKIGGCVLLLAGDESFFLLIWSQFPAIPLSIGRFGKKLRGARWPKLRPTPSLYTSLGSIQSEEQTQAFDKNGSQTIVHNSLWESPLCYSVNRERLTAPVGVRVTCVLTVTVTQTSSLWSVCTVMSWDINPFPKIGVFLYISGLQSKISLFVVSVAFCVH